MRRCHAIATIVLILGLAALGGGCRKKPVTPTPPPAARPVEPAQPSEPIKEVPPEPFPKEDVDSGPATEPGIDDLNKQGVLKTIYFDYDAHDLDEEDRATLRANADWLKAHPTRTIRVEGHCDERGTIEYNLALAERRAAAVREYLASLGINGSRMRIVSYGEERPAEAGHGEGAWSKNRRAEFLIES